MGIRAKTSQHRCPICRLHLGLCICSDLPRIETRTRLLLLIHHEERFKTTNTGELALACLPNSEERVHGARDHRPEPISADGSRLLLLFPLEGAVPLDQLPPSELPSTLIVPDGTWRQASKICKRFPGIEHALPVLLPEDAAPSHYQLRVNQREGGVATMEAIARAFGLLEGPEVRAQLEQTFRIVIDRILWMKGRISKDQVSGGVPPGAMRHDVKG